MRPMIAALAVLSLLVFVPSPAAAQQQAALTVVVEPVQTPLSEDVTQLVLQGTATLTADITAYTSLNGIPVQYMVSDVPAWATVIVSPASDVFTLPSTPGGASFTSTRTFTVTITVAEGPLEDATEAVEITGATTPGPLGAPASGRGSAVVAYDAPEEEPCPDHLASADWESLSVKAADAYNAHQAAPSGQSTGGDEVSVQTGGSSTLPMPWIVVGGFALIGAGVGLVLRRRFAAG